MEGNRAHNADHQKVVGDVGLAAVKAQEKLAKPTLQPSPGLGAWLRSMNGFLSFTTYQSSRLFFLFADDDGKVQAQERIVGSAMGMAIDHNWLWVANKEQVWRFSNVGAGRVAGQDWQAVYMPRKGYFLGYCDTHDLVAGGAFNGLQYELTFVNTMYSCIASIDAHYGFRPLWKPDFISALSPEDRCHLNGMGTQDGEIAFVTLCGRSDERIGWKVAKRNGGCVIDVRSNEVLCEGLSMPHSPRWYDGRLWLLNSGAGEFGYLDGNRFVPVAQCPGFARGLAFLGKYAVIGLSKLRENTFASGLTVKSKLDQANIPQRCGLLVVDTQTGHTVHWLTIEGVVSELYDVGFVPGITRPYTPGFSEPDLHKVVTHAFPGIFPFTSPRPKPRSDGSANETLSTQQVDGDGQ